MKKIFDKINKEKLFNILIIIIVILLYIFTALFIYSNFRERKRNELTNNIIKKVDDLIDNNKNTSSNNEEVILKHEGMNFTVIGKIRIDKINIYQPILKENNKYAYNVSVVKMSGPSLNTAGNVVIGGHNFMRGNFFIKINRLKKNDKIVITDLSGNSVDYYVYEYNVTSPYDASYLSKPANEDDKIITLVTCTKGGKERYYVKARAK